MTDSCDNTLHLYKSTPGGICVVSFYARGDQIVIEAGGQGQTRSRAVRPISEQHEVEASITRLMADGYAHLPASHLPGAAQPRQTAAAHGLHDSRHQQRSDPGAAQEMVYWLGEAIF